MHPFFVTRFSVGTFPQIWECAAQAPWWAPVSATGLSLAVVRVLFTFIGGLLTDIHGRRRACVVAMGVYFVFSLSRSFAPNVEVSIVAIVLEGAAVQTATFALILIGGCKCRDVQVSKPFICYLEEAKLGLIPSIFQSISKDCLKSLILFCIGSLILKLKNKITMRIRNNCLNKSA